LSGANAASCLDHGQDGDDQHQREQDLREDFQPHERVAQGALETFLRDMGLGVDVMITIFCDFLRKKLAFFSKPIL
jgi:hypothetical protein